ncbi:hypothetical protein ACFT8P_13515 [Streptomyces sp. NPDC057101]|uniref:hypothetical protein n=1 Tax=Streptomyces sp. NPDC057101 TaxID=3346020 RepID=UPI003627E22A
MYAKEDRRTVVYRFWPASDEDTDGSLTPAVPILDAWKVREPFGLPVADLDLTLPHRAEGAARCSMT